MSDKKEQPSDSEPNKETAIQRSEPQAVERVETQQAAELFEREPTGLISRMRATNLRSRKELEAAEVVLDAQLTELRHRGEAAARESKAYWDARSVEVASTIKTYVQARLRGMENERMAGRMDALQEAYELYHAKTKEILAGSMPDAMKEDLIKRLGDNLQETLRRIETDAIAGKHDLGD
jgi:hypothetical protein